MEPLKCGLVDINNTKEITYKYKVTYKNWKS